MTLTKRISGPKIAEFLKEERKIRVLYTEEFEHANPQDIVDLCFNLYRKHWIPGRRLRLGLGLFINCCLFVFHMDSNSTEDLCPDFIYLLLFVFPSAFQMINNKCRKHSYYHTGEPH